MRLLDTSNLKQLGLLALIIVVGLTIAKYSFTFFPSVLGAFTLYTLMRERYYRLVDEKKWKKWTAAALFIFVATIIFLLPVYLLLQLLIPRINALFSQSGQLNDILTAITQQLHRMNLPVTVSSEQIMGLVKDLSSSVPVVLGATANFLTNTLLAFFLLYFMLVEGKAMEATVQDYMPLKESNTDEIWHATRVMVKSNAIGIPVLAATQGLVAGIGYLIFGVDSYILWGVLTGLFSVVPIVGCMLVWGPIVIYLIASGNVGQATGLAIYSMIVTGGVDNVLRFTILKKLGDVHPIVTTFGIIVGVPLFGFMGFIFGPLLISYFLLLIKVYRIEFSPRSVARHNKDGTVI